MLGAPLLRGADALPNPRALATVADGPVADPAQPVAAELGRVGAESDGDHLDVMGHDQEYAPVSPWNVEQLVRELNHATAGERRAYLQKLCGPHATDESVLQRRALLFTALREAEVWPVP